MNRYFLDLKNLTISENNFFLCAWVCECIMECGPTYPLSRRQLISEVILVMVVVVSEGESIYVYMVSNREKKKW